MEPESEQATGEVTVRQAAEMLAVDRRTVRTFLKDGALSSRLVVVNNRAQHMIPEADVSRLLRERQKAAEGQAGKKGRPIVLPKGEGSTGAS